MCHDITHCKGIGCPIRDNCYRYQAHLEVVYGHYKSTRISYSYFVDDYKCNKAKEILNSEPIKEKLL